MMAYLKRLMKPTPVRPNSLVDDEDVTAAARPAAKEAEIKEARAQFVGELMAVQRKSHEIRHALAGSALSIVAGDR